MCVEKAIPAGGDKPRPYILSGTPVSWGWGLSPPVVDLPKIALIRRCSVAPERTGVWTRTVKTPGSETRKLYFTLFDIFKINATLVFRRYTRCSAMLNRLKKFKR